MVILVVALVWPWFSQAADPQPYAVTLNETGQAALDQALREASRLIDLEDTAPVGPFALVIRAQEDQVRYATVLRSFGYYQARIDIRIAGRPLNDPELPAWLEQAPAQPPAPVTITVEPGPEFHLRRIDIQGTAPAAARDWLGLPAHAPAQAPEVLAARERLVTALRRQGYALAKVDPPIATLWENDRVLDVVYPVDAGPRLDLGAITLKGLHDVDEAFVRRRLSVHPGQRYDPEALDRDRRDLLGLGVFTSVRVVDADQPNAQGRLPISFEFSERQRRSVSLNAAYSTDLGGSFAASWQHHNLFGAAEQLTLTAAMTQLGGNSTTGIGYELGANLLKPDFLRRDQNLQAHLGAFKQNLIAYDREALLGELRLSRKFREHWQANLGFSGEQARVTQQGQTEDYTLIGLPLVLKYDNTDSLLDPTRGLRLALAATPTLPLAGPQTDPFIPVQISGSGYLDLGAPGRSVLAVRGLLGTVQGATRDRLPPDKRYYAGGTATVRGYQYQSVGPQFPDHTPRGGTSVVAGTVEFRQRILESYGAVLFVDAGQVAAGSLFAGTWGVGAGVGFRYYTAIGAIRLDVAVPVVHLPDSGSFEVYIGLGQAF